MTEKSAYQSASIQTADRVRIVSLLYDGAINFLNLSRKRFEQGDIAGKGMYLGKTTSIIGELACSLNMESGGEISANLSKLYAFIMRRLIDISIKNDLKGYDDSLRVLSELRAGWKQMELNYRRSNATVTAPQAGAAPMLANIRA